MKNDLISKWLIIVILHTLVIPLSAGIGVVTATNSEYAPSQSGSWLVGWDYRISHTINGTIGAGFNYQIEIDVRYGSGTSSGNIVYLGLHSNTDFSDIRFTDDDGITLLDYWLEAYEPGVSAVFWVEVSDSLDTTSTIFIYYGNPSAMSMSNGDATFIFFDDFEDGTLNKWTTVDSMWGISNTISANGRYSAWADTFTSIDNRELSKEVSISQNVMIHVWIRTQGDPNWPIHPANDRGYSIYTISLMEDSDIKYYDGSLYHTWPQNSKYMVDTWQRFEVGYDFDADVMLAWKDRMALHGTDSIDLLDDTGTTGDGLSKISSICSRFEGRDLWLDDYYVRKWVQNEPTHGVWGSVESNAESTQTTQSPSWFVMAPFMYLAVGAGLGVVAIVVIVLIVVIRNQAPPDYVPYQVLDDKKPVREGHNY